MLKCVEFILYSDAFTFHGEEKDGVSSLYKIPALGSEVGEIRCSAGAWPSEILGPVCVCDLNAHLARVVPEKSVRVCLKGHCCDYSIFMVCFYIKNNPFESY